MISFNDEVIFREFSLWMSNNKFLGGGGGGGNKTYHARIITLEVNYTNSDGVRKVSAQLQWSEALEIMDKG